MYNTIMKTLRILDICQAVNGQLTGNEDLIIEGLNNIQNATRNQLTFIGQKKYISQWETSNASAVIINSDLVPLLTLKSNTSIISVTNSDLAMAQILELFEPELPSHCNIHPTAVIESSAQISNNVEIGPNCYIGHNCQISENVKIFANTTIYNDCKIDANTQIWSGTVVRERSIIGKHCTISANVTIGSDGFGYRPSSDGQSIVKIPHIGNVVIGNYVDIGSGSCIDRGKFSSTIIGDFTKIDNLVQIGHNCIVGKGCILCGACGLSGSVILEDGVTIGGAANIKDHLTIGAGAKIGGRAGVINDVPAKATYIGFPADSYGEVVRQWAAIKQLPSLAKSIKKIIKSQKS